MGGGPRKLSATSFMCSLALRGFGVQQGVGAALFSTSTAAGRPFVPLVKVGDGGKWCAIKKKAELMDMVRADLLEALAGSKIFGPDLKDVRLGACTVHVIKGALPEGADEPTAAQETGDHVVELKGAKTIGEVAGDGSFFLRIYLPQPAAPAVTLLPASACEFSRECGGALMPSPSPTPCIPPLLRTPPSHPPTLATCRPGGAASNRLAEHLCCCRGRR